MVFVYNMNDIKEFLKSCEKELQMEFSNFTWLSECQQVGKDLIQVGSFDKTSQEQLSDLISLDKRGTLLALEKKSKHLVPILIRDFVFVLNLGFKKNGKEWQATYPYSSKDGIVLTGKWNVFLLNKYKDVYEKFLINALAEFEENIKKVEESLADYALSKEQNSMVEFIQENAGKKIPYEMFSYYFKKYVTNQSKMIERKMDMLAFYRKQAETLKVTLKAWEKQKEFKERQF